MNQSFPDRPAPDANGPITIHLRGGDTDAHLALIEMIFAVSAARVRQRASRPSLGEQPPDAGP